MQNATKTENNRNKRINKKEEDRSYYFKKRNYNFWLCCGPAVDDIKYYDKKAAAEPVLETSKMKREDGASCFSPGSENEVVAGADRKMKFRRDFSRVLKAVLFETSLAKKIKKRKILQKLLQSDGKSSSAKFGRDAIKSKRNSINSTHQELPTKNDGKIISNFGPPNFSNPTFVSERSPSFQSNLLDSKQNQIDVQVTGKGSLSSNTGMYLLLVSLLILVLCGKACAILCTSTWLFLVSRWNSRKKSPDWTDPQKLDSVEHKKRIIMEGLLERNPL